MDTVWKDALWQQFGSSIDMLDNALMACPDEAWADGSQYQDVWYIIYHTLFWLDLYLSGAVEGFAPPPPYNLDELDPAGILPDRVYSKDELRAYLRHGRQKCQTIIEALTDEKASHICRFPRREHSFLELLLYNMRHVEYHVGELYLILGQKTGSGPNWVGKAKSALPDT